MQKPYPSGLKPINVGSLCGTGEPVPFFGSGSLVRQVEHTLTRFSSPWVSRRLMGTRLKVVPFRSRGPSVFINGSDLSALPLEKAIWTALGFFGHAELVCVARRSKIMPKVAPLQLRGEKTVASSSPWLMLGEADVHLVEAEGLAVARYARVSLQHIGDEVGPGLFR
jgi:hypothetical protein